MVSQHDGRGSPRRCQRHLPWEVAVVVFVLLLASCLETFAATRGSPSIQLPLVLQGHSCRSFLSGRGSTFLSSPRAALPQQWHPFQEILRIRGGNDEEDEENGDSEGEDYDEEAGDAEDEELDGSSTSAAERVEEDSTSVSLLNLSKRVVILTGQLTFRLVKATSRVFVAIFQSDDTGEEHGDDVEGATVAGKLLLTVQRMWRALWNEPEEKTSRSSATTESKSSAKATANKNEKTEVVRVAPTTLADFGSYLSQTYSVEATRTKLDKVPPVLSGSLSEALAMARSQARLLVVFIPSSKPDGKHDTSADEDAIKGFLSLEVATVAERKARKKEETGSYVLWSAKPGSSEAVATSKRLKAATTNSKGQKRPVLLVAYPQLVVDRGIPKIVPRLLAQHHCTPPPSPELMAAWLNALRKRHAKQYATMQLELREGQLMKDRIEGYHGSIHSDRERQERERRELEQKLLEEKAELERQEAVLQRRKSLLLSLPEEPPSTSGGSMTIALRFADGRSSQRRFAPESKVSTLFNWVDALFEMEREHITLTTLNGQKSYVWEESGDLSLADAGFARMTGLRVTERKADVSASS